MTCKKLFFALLFISNLINGQSLRHLLNNNNYPAVDNKILDLSNLSLSNINGIEDYPEIENVEYLILRDNKIKSLKPLLDLYRNHKNKLKVLDICSNEISDISYLYSFRRSLKHLHTEYNKLKTKDLMYILMHFDLESLFIDSNPINDPVYIQSKIAGIKNQNYLDIINYTQRRKLGNVELFKITEGEFVCGICINEESKEDLYSTRCTHSFHLACLARWLYICKRNGQLLSCPNCRGIL